jgi:hypothetical protein
LFRQVRPTQPCIFVASSAWPMHIFSPLARLRIRLVTHGRGDTERWPHDNYFDREKYAIDRFIAAIRVCWEPPSSNGVVAFETCEKVVLSENARKSWSTKIPATRCLAEMH